MAYATTTDLVRLGIGAAALTGVSSTIQEAALESASDMADGVISSNDLGRIDTECGQLIASVHALRKALGARHQADTAALMRRVVG